MRRTTLLRRILNILVISALTALFFTCSDESKIQEQQEKITVSFFVKDNSARTVLPQVSLDDAASYKLLGGKTGEAETVLVESFTGDGTSLSLESGTWNFTLNAYNNSGDHILQGTVRNRQISSTSANNVSFSLSVVTDGAGSMQVTLNFPETAGITKITTDGDVDSENFTSIANGTFVYTKNNVLAGDYFINFKLYSGELLKAVVSELVLVRKNLTSSKAITLVGDNLKPLPEYEITIDPIITGTLDEWTLLTDQSTQAVHNENKQFTVTGTYTAYQWYLDGVAAGTSSSYTFNKPAGVYQLVVVVTNSSGESRSGRCRVTVSQAAVTLPPETVTIFSEDFEGTNSFTIVNGTQTNQWYVGTAVRYAGSKSAYISNNSGTSNAYTITSDSRVHMYRDVTFPFSTTPYSLTFYWRAQGERSGANYYDYLSVSLIETSVTPTAGLMLSGSELGKFNNGGASTWNPASISIPVANNAGTTKRLVFTWINDAVGGTTPPAAVDNILLTGVKGPTSDTYTVTYNINNGSGTVISSQPVTSGSSITLPGGNGLTRSGYTFGGWNTSAAGTGTNYEAGSSYTPTGNVTLYARWLSCYTVTFNVNSGTGTVPVARTVISGTAVTLPSGSGLTRSGYAFGGWNTSSAGTGTNYESSTSFTPTADITLYAKWTSTTQYTVTFNVNGGSGTTPSSQTVLSGTAITLPSGSGLTRSGYTFGGWNTSSAGSGTNYNAGDSYTVTAAATLYAKWNNNSGISDPNGSEANPYPLTADLWFSGNITSSSGTVWYSFPVTNGTTYRVWWNDKDEGNNTKTGDVVVAARYSTSASFIFGGASNTVDRGYNTPQSFTANQTGTVYIKVMPYNNGSTYIGTYGIVYSTSSTRPTVPTGISTAPYPLTMNRWEDGTLTTSTTTLWYTFPVTSGTTYYVWWNDKSDGNGTTGEVVAGASYNTSIFFFGGNDQSIDSGYTTPQWFTANQTGTVQVRITIRGGNNANVGTFAVAYNTSGTRP